MYNDWGRSRSQGDDESAEGGTESERERETVLATVVSNGARGDLPSSPLRRQARVVESREKEKDRERCGRSKGPVGVRGGLGRIGRRSIHSRG